MGQKFNRGNKKTMSVVRTIYDDLVARCNHVYGHASAALSKLSDVKKDVKKHKDEHNTRISLLLTRQRNNEFIVTNGTDAEGNTLDSKRIEAAARELAELNAQIAADNNSWPTKLEQLNKAESDALYDAIKACEAQEKVLKQIPCKLKKLKRAFQLKGRPCNITQLAIPQE